MPNRRRSSGQRAAPKLFRCTGYGNCDMVFTRSEHLARHERKHTGEKPYRCVVPGCGRMFSRFDNMMQHTQTHEKNKKMVPSSTPSAVEKIVASPTAIVHGHNVRAPTMTPIKTEPASWIDQQRNQPIPDLVMATSGVPPLEHSSMINSRTLPLPTRRASFSAYNNEVAYPPPPPQPNYRSPYPYPYYTNDNGFYSNNIPRNRSSWPVRREPYQHYYQTQAPPPQQYYNSRNDDYYNTIRRRSSTSTLSSDSTLISPTTYQHPQDPQIVRRRISIDDLRLPIENLRNIQLDEEKSYYKYYNNNISNNNNTVDITPDEYEALEGFSKFHSSSVIARDSSSPTELTPSPVLRNESPNMAAQVCAMRQRVMTLNESFQRR